MNTVTRLNVEQGLASPNNPTVRQKFSLRGTQIFPYLFLLPGMLLFALFIIWPMLYSLRISFSDWNVVHPEKSINVGFQNYADVLADPIFHRAVVNTLVYVVITVPGQIIFEYQFDGRRCRVTFRRTFEPPPGLSWS